jgi:N-acetylmuramoyl-L-alanine amidase
MTANRDEVRRIFSCLMPVLVGIFVLAPAVLAATTVRQPIERGMVAALDSKNRLYLEATPRRGEGAIHLARRLCGDSSYARDVRDANGGVRQLKLGVRYRVPFAILLPKYQRKVVEAMFERDRALADGWSHSGSAARGAPPSTLWRIAEWFTGDGRNYPAIRDFNRLSDEMLTPGQTIVVPAELLTATFREQLPPAVETASSTGPGDSPLEYGSDDRGEYAIYRLQRGEALYSSVVVRFTGRVFAADVNALAAQIAERSGIPDVTDIPVAFPVKIPLDMLLAENLPVGHPRREEYDQNRAASGQFSNQVQAKYLEDITIVLDAGHGGKDVGASVGGVWESIYAYDIMVRVKTLLEETTAARVVATTRDGAHFTVQPRDELPFSRAHRVLTTPNYVITDSVVGVHLRWYLANSVYRQAVERTGDPEKVIFISVHADSLHPSLRGAMVYIPGARWRGGSYGKSGNVYASRREYKEGPRVSISKRDLVKSEGLSRELAQDVLGALRGAGVAIHDFKPVRDKITRGRRSYVPAVLRYNRTPAEILLEVCNLANAADRRLLQTQAFRQTVAEAVVQGILSYYGTSEAAARVTTAG